MPRALIGLFFNFYCKVNFRYKGLWVVRAASTKRWVREPEVTWSIIGRSVSYNQNLLQRSPLNRGFTAFQLRSEWGGELQ